MLDSPEIIVPARVTSSTGREIPGQHWFTEAANSGARPVHVKSDVVPPRYGIRYNPLSSDSVMRRDLTHQAA